MLYGKLIAIVSVKGVGFKEKQVLYCGLKKRPLPAIYFSKKYTG